MEWTVKLEARSGWGGVETVEVARLSRRAVGLTADETSLSPADAEGVLAALQRHVLETQMQEYTTCARALSGRPRCRWPP